MGPPPPPPPPPEQAPRPRPEVNTGRPRGRMGSGSWRGEVGAVPGPRRAEERARGDRRADKVSELRARPRRRSALGGKLELPLEAGEAAAGRPPRSFSLPREGGPASAAAALQSTPCPISSLWPTRLPAASAGEACSLLGAGSGVCVWSGGRGLSKRFRDRVATQAPSPCGENVSCWSSGRSPAPQVRFTWKTLLLSVVSKPACETKLYYVVTSQCANREEPVLPGIGVCPTS